jgi:hypothetical protein
VTTHAGLRGTDMINGPPTREIIDSELFNDILFDPNLESFSHLYSTPQLTSKLKCFNGVASPKCCTYFNVSAPVGQWSWPLLRRHKTIIKILKRYDQVL